jgi:hypothetical protein
MDWFGGAKNSRYESCNAPVARSLDEDEVEEVFKTDSGYAVDHMRTLFDDDVSSRIDAELSNAEWSVLFDDQIWWGVSFIRVLQKG